MSFLLNAWHVAAFSTEIAADRPLARTLLDQPVVMYREADGTPVVLDDRCAHRFAPLSRGKIVDGSLECPYHGLRFGATGQCVHNPHGDGRIPSGARVRRFPSVERYGAVWFWPGEPSAANAASIPAFPFVERDTNITHDGYLLTRANYQLSADNLLDLSHFQFLHPDTLGSEAMASGDVQSGGVGDTVWIRRTTEREVLPPFVAQGFGIPEGMPVDRWMDVRWSPPGLLSIVVGVTPAGMPREAGLISPSAHWLTPETATTTHYFFSFGLPNDMGAAGQELVRYAVDGLMKPFEHEDLPMLEAQQIRMAGREFWSMQPALLPIDTGAIRARRVMERLLAEESTQRATTNEVPFSPIKRVERASELAQ